MKTDDEQEWRLHGMRRGRRRSGGLGLALGLATACTPQRPLPVEPAPPAPGTVSESSDATFARALAAGLVEACPLAADSDLDARQECADRLTTFTLLRDSLRNPVLWGGQSAGYDLHANRTTQMNALVLRRMYLSTFAFGPDYRIDASPAGTAVLHISSRFRRELDPGDYPYPFWHSADKWRSYERARELLFFVEGGVIKAVLRSQGQDPELPHVERTWDGQWRWQSARGEEPKDALYRSLFSKTNPHVPALDAAYREFERAQRTTECVSCHDPSNKAKANPLELFSYPNQALSGRHDIVRELENNEMPPATAAAPAGIEDSEYRQRLLRLAREFAAAGDQALQFEGESTR